MLVSLQGCLIHNQVPATVLPSGQGQGSFLPSFHPSSHRQDQRASPPQSDEDEPADPNPPEPYQDYVRRMAINDEDDDEPAEPGTFLPSFLRR